MKAYVKEKLTHNVVASFSPSERHMRTDAQVLINEIGINAVGLFSFEDLYIEYGEQRMELAGYVCCYSCGRDPNDDLIDQLYPTKRDKQTGDFIEWNFYCATHNGGCGRTVYGATKQEVVDKWTQGKTEEII